MAEAMEAANLILGGCKRLSGYYVYLLIDPRGGDVFYVGKGKGRRAFAHETAWFAGDRQNVPKADRIGSIVRSGLHVECRCFLDNLSEDDAFDLERWLIRQIGIRNLTNLLPGQQSPTRKLIALIKDEISLIRPYCRWKNYILPQFDSARDMAHEDLEKVYWDTTGFLSEQLAKLEGRKYREFGPMWSPKRSSA